MLILSPMRLMTSRASLLECRLMQMGFLALLRLIAVAGQASTHWIGLHESGELPACGLWQSVQSPAAPGCCTFAFSICSALSAWQVTQSSFAVGCVRTTFPSLARRVARVAGLLRERRMKEFRHQLRRC